MDLHRIVEEGWVKLYQGSILDGLINFSTYPGGSWGKLYADEVARDMEGTIPVSPGTNVYSIQETGCPFEYHPVYVDEDTGKTYEAIYTIDCDIDEQPAPVPCSLLLVGTGLMGIIGLRRTRRTRSS